jgi:hypothetical protein
VKGFIDLLEGRSTVVARHSEIDTHTRMLKFVKLNPTKLAASYHVHDRVSSKKSLGAARKIGFRDTSACFDMSLRKFWSR